MSALIVRGDYVEAIRREIVAHGHADLLHWNGRKTAFARRQLPRDAELVVVLCDYVSHNLMGALKRNARRSGASLLFCRHSTHDLKTKLDAIDLRASGPGGPAQRT